MHRKTRHTLAFASLALVAGSLFVGCGDDEPDDTAAGASDRPTTEQTEQTETTAGGGSGDVATAACDASVELAAAFGNAPEAPDEFGAFAEETLVPIGEAFTGSFAGDDELGEAAKTLADAYTEIAESGDPSGLESPEVEEARTAIGEAVHDGCDLEAVEVTAVEYAFQGVPEELDAGRVSFALTNEGVEDHEMVLLRRNDGVTESLEELLAQGEAAQEKTTFTGVTFGGPDSTTYVAADLEPGTYFLVCFIPVGGGEDGPPHFMEGMQHTITVS